MAVRRTACCAYLFVQQVHEPGLKFVHFGLGVLHFAAMKTRKNYAKQTSPLSHSQTMDASIAPLSSTLISILSRMMLAVRQVRC